MPNIEAPGATRGLEITRISFGGVFAAEGIANTVTKPKVSHIEVLSHNPG